MGGPLVRWRQIQPSYMTSWTWKTQRLPSFSFALQSTTDVPIFVVNISWTRLLNDISISWNV
jgi:hypothetical protein